MSDSGSLLFLCVHIKDFLTCFIEGKQPWVLVMRYSEALARLSAGLEAESLHKKN